MASSFIANAYQVHFESVLAIPDHEGMLNMFRALEASGLRGFLGCESVLYDKELEQFFDRALVQNGDITDAVSGKFFSVSQSRFAEIFAIPTEGLVDFFDVLKNMVYDARSIFSKSGEQVSTHGKKKFMTYEYLLLNDILAKAITVKAGSFDAVTNEHFLMMTAIHFGLIPAITMGDAVPFPTSKVLSITTVNSYIAMNHTVDARGQSEEPSMANVAVVKRKSKSKRKPKSTDETPVEVISEIAGSKKRPAVEGNEPVIPKKRRTVKSKASPSKAGLDVVPVAQEAVPLTIVEPTPAATAAKSPAPKRKSRKRRLLLPTDSDDETVDEQDSVKETTEVTDKETAVKHTDEMDIIIGQVLEETSMLTTDETEQGKQHIDETDIGDDFERWLDESFKDFASRDNDQVVESTNELDRGTETEERVADEQTLEMVDETGTIAEADGSEQVVVAKNIEKSVGSHKYDEEQMSLDDLLMQISDDMMLPSVTVAEDHKGKEPLEEDEPVKGNPAREMVELICGDVDFLVQLRNQVMKDVVEFFHSFSLNKLSDLASLRDLKEKEKLMLSWAGTEFLETAVKRKMYILAKYREMLLRKFLDSHRRYFEPGQPWTAMDSQIIDLLSAAHAKSLTKLQAQQQEHRIEMVQPSSSLSVIDSTAGSCAVLAQFYSMAKSICWVRPMILIDGTWTPLHGNDYWKSSCRLFLFVNRKLLPESVVEENFVPHVFFIEPAQYWGATPSLIKSWGWARVCTEVVRYSMFGCLRPVRVENLCRAFIAVTSVVDIFEKLPTGFCRVVKQGESANNFIEFVQRPDSPTSTDSPMRFTADDISLDTITDNQILLPVGPTKSIHLKEAFEMLCNNKNKPFEIRYRVLAKTIARKKEVKAIDAKVTYFDGQVAAIRSEFFDFQAKVAENLLTLSTQLGDLFEYIRGGDAKKGEGSSSRPQPPTDDQGGSSGGRGTGDNIRKTNIVDRFPSTVYRESRGRSSGGSRTRGGSYGHSKKRSSSSAGGPFRSFWYNQSLDGNSAVELFKGDQRFPSTVYRESRGRSSGGSRTRGGSYGHSKKRSSSSAGGPFRRSFEDWLG
ncbi:cell division control protein 2C-like [Dorcoceras hygrometricum]|uniref:Cell division control protein 2C-like n=1 Tax=Dorcoceras hygrometricum TaxID=472368 RepID=A0A2Z7DG23_9LAMI|nr:cell division control protein 2C-like [Dorcoceras hygrometricum]